MLKIELDANKGIAVFQPEGALSEADFEAAAEIIDPYLESKGMLRGLIIKSQKFPGWESFGAMIGHVKFVKNHHHQLSHVALVTDSSLGDVVEKLAGHFVSAEIRRFPFAQIESAISWAAEEPRA